MRENEFREFIDVLGQWFDGFAKFALIVKRHNEGFYSGERKMIEKLAVASLKIDKYLREQKQQGKEIEPEQSDVLHSNEEV